MSKKILAVLLTAALIVTAAGCGPKEEETTTTTTDTTVAEETVDTEATTEENVETEVTEESVETEATEETAEEEVKDATAGAFACTELTDVILNSGIEFPAVGPVEDEASLTDFFGYDLSLFDDYSIIANMMSVHLIEITVAKVVPGQEEAALELLNNRMNQLKTECAFYPAQQETADQTVVGSAGGYVYLICCNDAAKAEETLLAKING